MMKILVCITQAPDTTAKIEFTNNNAEFNEQGVTYIINPYDEWYSLVRAIELKEAGVASEIHLVTVGTAQADAIIRKALALGGDQAYRIDAPAQDTFEISQLIADFAKDKDYGLIFTGKESIDYNNASVGTSIAGLLDYNFVGLVSTLDINGQEATLTRDIEGGVEKVAVALPLVISSQKGLAEARIPNMRGIMAARTKPLNVVAAESNEALTSIVEYEKLPPKSGVKLFTEDQIDDLVAALHNEAKVI